jgi:hypothetical protein
MSTQLKRRLGQYRWRHFLIEVIGFLGRPGRFGQRNLQFLWSQTDRCRVYQTVLKIERFYNGIQ